MINIPNARSKNPYNHPHQFAKHQRLYMEIFFSSLVSINEFIHMNELKIMQD